MPTMFNPFDRRAKTAPSQYPKVPFHGIRLAQLVSSLIVGAIMSYFTWHLTHDGWATPWTFIWLMAASLFSIAALLFTIMLHCFVGLNPKLNLGVNGGLTILWALSWALLTWSMSGTLKNMCDIEHWKEDTGIMVCRIYKTLFTFTLLGLLSTIAALCLDLYVFRSHTRRGIYKLQDLDGKPGAQGTRTPFTEDEPRESTAWEAPRPSMGPYGSDRERQEHGYMAPSGQFSYDTGYHGHGPDQQRLFDDA